MANNVIKRIWNQNKLVNIEALDGMAFQAEDGGHTFEISGVDDGGNPVALSGTVAGVFVRPDNADIALSGTASDGKVYVTLSDACYTVPGKFGLTIFVTADSKKTAVYAAIGTVNRTSGGSVAGDTPQDVVDLINAISEAVATIPASYSGLMADIAPVYSSSAVYPVGAYVYYNGNLYRCTTSITTAESWTAAHWTTAVLGNDVTDLKSALYNDYSPLKPLTINLFDKTAITPNCYINMSNGEYAGIGNTNYYASDFIEVEEGKRYYIEGTANNQGAYYDKNRNYVSGFVNTNTVFNNQDIPSGVKYVRFSGVTNGLNTAFMSLNNERIIARDIDSANKFSFEKGIIADRISSEKIVYEITVTTDVELCQKINSLNYLSKNQKCIVYVAEGTYYLNLTMLSNNGFGTYGLYLPDNVDLIGLGKGAIIDLNLTGESAGSQKLISTLNFNKNNNIENITLKANNCRYALHLDNGNSVGDCTERIRNCKFIHYGCSDGNWEYPTALGEGTSSGNHIVFENCDFISPWRAYYLHNNTEFAKPSYHKFVNCRFVSTTNVLSFQIEGLGSTVIDEIELVGCVFNANFDGRKNSSATSGQNGNDFIVYGHGNGNIAENWYYADGSYNFIRSEYATEIINLTGSDMARWTPIKISNGAYVPMESGDSCDVCIGITIEPITNGETGYIITGGYFNISNITRMIGAKIGVSNGSLSVVTGDDYIGVVKYRNETYDRTYMLIGK